jgi:hypothetical protein
MGVQEILKKYVADLEPSVRIVLVDVIIAEQQYADLKNSRAVKERIRQTIDKEVMASERDK